MKKHTPAVLIIATMLLCTTWLTLEQDRAQRDRSRLFKDLIEQSWKIQTDMNGMWEPYPGGSRRSLPPSTKTRCHSVGGARYTLTALEATRHEQHLPAKARLVFVG